jgi:virginiamycin B lyase
LRNVSVYDLAAKACQQWKFPGASPRTYAVWSDPDDKVWLTDWSTNAVVRFDPETQTFQSFPSDRSGTKVRQLLGREKAKPGSPKRAPSASRVIRYP